MPDPTPPAIQTALLGFLVAGPRHGYELYHEFSADLGRVWQLGRSKLYAQLKQAEEAGWVASETELQENRPPRKVYQLTPVGEQAFRHWLHQPTPNLRQIRVEFLARIYFFQRFELPELYDLVARQKELLQSRIDSLAGKAAETDDSFWHLVLEFRRGQLEAVVRWLDGCIPTA